MEEIFVKDNPLGIKVYAVGQPSIEQLSEEEYGVFVSSLAVRINALTADTTNEEKEENSCIRK